MAYIVLGPKNVNVSGFCLKKLGMVGPIFYMIFGHCIKLFFPFFSIFIFTLFSLGWHGKEPNNEYG